MSPKAIDQYFQDAVRASNVYTPRLIELFIPDRDKNNQPITDIRSWIDQAIQLLANINGGITLTSKQGAWINPETGHLVIEGLTHIESYILPDRFQSELCRLLPAFLHAFGSATNQGEVHVRLDGIVYALTDFNTAISNASIRKSVL